MLDLSGVSNGAILATITKYEGILAGTRYPLWDVCDCEICAEGEMDCVKCCLTTDNWCDHGEADSRLYPDEDCMGDYMENTREFLALVKAERHRRGL
jgi:hypothetical protein